MLLAKAVAVQWWVASWFTCGWQNIISCLHPASSPLLGIDIMQCENGCLMHRKDSNICVHHSAVFASGGCCDNYTQIFIQSANHFFVIDSFWLLGLLENCTLGKMQWKPGTGFYTLLCQADTALGCWNRSLQPLSHPPTQLQPGFSCVKDCFQAFKLR